MSATKTRRRVGGFGCVCVQCLSKDTKSASKRKINPEKTVCALRPVLEHPQTRRNSNKHKPGAAADPGEHACANADPPALHTPPPLACARCVCGDGICADHLQPVGVVVNGARRQRGLQYRGCDSWRLAEFRARDWEAYWHPAE